MTSLRLNSASVTSEAIKDSPGNSSDSPKGSNCECVQLGLVHSKHCCCGKVQITQSAGDLNTFRNVRDLYHKIHRHTDFLNIQTALNGLSTERVEGMNVSKRIEFEQVQSVQKNRNLCTSQYKVCGELVDECGIFHLDRDVTRTYVCLIFFVRNELSGIIHEHTTYHS